MNMKQSLLHPSDACIRLSESGSRYGLISGAPDFQLDDGEHVSVRKQKEATSLFMGQSEVGPHNHSFIPLTSDCVVHFLANKTFIIVSNVTACFIDGMSH